MLSLYELIQLVGDENRQDSKVLEDYPLVSGMPTTNVCERFDFIQHHENSITKDGLWEVT